MDRKPPEPKRAAKDKARKEPPPPAPATDPDDPDDADDEEEKEVLPPPSVGEEEKRRRPSPSSAAVTSRRGSGGAGGAGQQPSCQAERCEADLTEAKRYHRRHKVCEAHSKAPVVIVAGLRQRFCQQCSRFHELSEFDETKRSCRRRLAGHNERRRKSSSEPQGEGSSRCRQADQGGRIQTSLPGGSAFKHFQIR